jgi:hypothetical protein
MLVPSPVFAWAKKLAKMSFENPLWGAVAQARHRGRPVHGFDLHGVAARSAIADVEDFLSKYASYYNEARTHVSLGKDAPYTRPIERFGTVVAHAILGGLHHRYTRI